ncbi:hypothetical protein CDD82_5258 [Ophiocordyceps australis]|uniref:Uncharacterized protein n=1 Tax=Ophiocordyceps australis TaxID=1399860 RepID=A0A2C5Z2C7_9HYPO|nr:hypothetical protein CDD82_5258 [Ophiocordyceps australis]
MHHHHGPRTNHSLPQSPVSHQELRSILVDTPNAQQAREWSKYYASGPHLAGKNYSQAEWTKDKWETWGIDSTIVEYDVYLNYPVDHGLSMHAESGGSWHMTFNASLTEDVLEQDPTTGLHDRIPTFHGYSCSGNVTGSFVYVNYATYQDFDDLVQAGVALNGNIAIAKYGGNFRGLKVQRAQELGMIGIVMYSDPGDDGNVTEENGYKPYPEGPARNPSSVQRGSVQFLSVRAGDPTTPGYPSKPGVPRAPLDDVIPSIPSLPISYTDAIPILKALNGHGPKAADLGNDWKANLGLGAKGVAYNIGPSPSNLVLNLYNKQEYTTTPLWNVIGVVNGTNDDEVIVVGNHRDAWIAGGAGDPNSGSAVLNEVVRSVGKALEAGWKPLRTIVFASWDGEEYALIGSTEWVEEYIPWLSKTNVAYLNVDVGTAGPVFQAAAAPLLNQVLRQATHLVPSPNQTTEHQTVGDVWDGNIATMGSGSDFTAFQDHAGVPCIDMGFKNGESDPVYHYHSNYDSFHWMEEYGDVGFKYHVAMAQIVGVLVSELVDAAIIPFNATEYADSLVNYLGQVEDAFKSKMSTKSSSNLTGSRDEFEQGLKRIRQSLTLLRTKAVELDNDATRVMEMLASKSYQLDMASQEELSSTICRINSRYKYLERNFLYDGGLDNRSWFKHVVFAPGLWTGYSGAVFPGLVESIDAGNYTNGQRWSDIIDARVKEATKSIT